MFRAQRILVPVDSSPESSLALEWAIRVAKDVPEACLFLCQVLAEAAPVGPEPMIFEYGALRQAQERTSQKKLREMQHRIPAAIRSSYVVRWGGVADQIAKLCQEEAVDLVVMTTQGRRGLSHFLRSSVSEETVRLAPCPVLVLHLNQATEEAVHATQATVGAGWR